MQMLRSSVAFAAAVDEDEGMVTGLEHPRSIPRQKATPEAKVAGMRSTRSHSQDAAFQK